MGSVRTRADSRGSTRKLHHIKPRRSAQIRAESLLRGTMQIRAVQNGTLYLAVPRGSARCRSVRKLRRNFFWVEF